MDPSPATLTRRVRGDWGSGDQAARPRTECWPCGDCRLPVALRWPPSSSEARRPLQRPGFGMEGMRCIVRANHFLVEVASRNLHRYDVAITPKVTSKAVCRKIISELVKIYKDSHLERRTPAYDGMKSLYTAGALPFTSQQFKIKLAEKDRGDKEFDVTIKCAGHADLHHLDQLLHGRQFDALDIVLRESPSQKYVTIARSFFSKDLGATEDIGGGLECWRGYYQKLRPTQMGLSLNIGTAATPFYHSIPVIDFAKEYLNIGDAQRTLTEKQRIALTKALRGIRVGVTHRDTSRRYKINGLSNEPLAQLMFPVDDKGNKKLVVQYFQEKYNCKLVNLTWPCLQSGSGSNPTHLPMEVCKIVEGQRFLQKLEEKQVTEILRATCQRPHEREESIRKIVMENNYEDDEYAQEFGIKVAKQLTSVEARVLLPPKLQYHNTGVDKTWNPKGGAWSMFNKKMYNGGTIYSWACVNFSHELYCNNAAVRHFCGRLFSTCKRLGMSIEPDPVIEDLHERANNVEAALRTVHAQATTALGGGTTQSTIKRVCETELGLISQCCLSKHVKACNRKYLENVALKINVKVGGRNTVLSDVLSKKMTIVTDVPTIIFGADVTHPTAGDGASPSIAAVVASMDWPEVTKYKALISSQPPRKEIIEDLYTTTQGGHGGMIRDLLRSFNSATGHEPQRIIFYRDGVSETQFSQVLLHEVDAIKKACQSLREGYRPGVTFVVVQKRHHTRLFPETHGSEQTDGRRNILPGTVVDRKICHPSEFDFFLCSHSGVQGTSRPAHYHVLWDDNEFSADQLQGLTNSLCYTYARCTRSVSLVPPVYYAHLAAFRARYYFEGGADIRSIPHVKDNVKEVMFYC
ncbi:protein argonaute MEL1-like [Asparagus officinalis]|uniref:protein argonaute MEL1-like n=1 Tax=Asparagus officinalis TaxID=4686 RepID=UPI00098E69A9|nr:protein argonaute MEL1-like [Asparagus officinalis]